MKLNMYLSNTIREGYKMITNIREINPKEISFLEKMLYQAIYVPEEEKDLPLEIIKMPELLSYINNFGKSGDYCLVSEFENNLIGAIWIRLFPKADKGYGYVDEFTPELSIAIDKKYRGKEIGTKLMKEMLKHLIESGYIKVSLSVDERNRAFNLYKKFDFKTVEIHDMSHVMVKNLI